MDQFSLGANECLGITKISTKLKILGQSEEIEVSAGEIIKILRLASLGLCFIKLYSSDKRNLILSDETYSCDQNAIKIINEKLGSMLITIGDRDKRVMICNNSENERFLVNLKLNDVVKVNKFILKRDHHVVCTVKYIGVVPEIGPGTYVGCTLYDETDTIIEKNKLAMKYFTCNEKNGFIRSCGCFFTRTMLLEQGIDNLMKIVRATKHKNTYKPKQLDPVPEPKIITTEIKSLNKTTTSEPQQISPTTVNMPSSYNRIPPPTVYRSAHVYPETRPVTLAPTTNYVHEAQFFNNRTSGMRYDTATETRASLNWTPPQYKVTLNPVTSSPLPPKKKRCSVM